MEPIRRILVGLDNTEMNTTLVEFAAFLARHGEAEEIYFVNVAKNLNLPQEVLKEFPDIEIKALKERKIEISKLIEAHFRPERSIPTHIIVEKGNPTKKIMDLTHTHTIDLLVIGRKKSIPGSGVMVQRLGRRADCNLLIVPEGAKPRAEKILVPIDFSDYSKLALEQTIDLAKNYKDKVEIICQNVYTVPVGYHYTGKSYEEFGKVMCKNAEKDYKKFIKDIDTKGIKIKAVYSLDENDNLASDIRDLAESTKADVIIIGAKGRTATTALFLGSFAEKLINVEEDIPLIITRPKGKNPGLMEYLKEI